MERKDEKEAIIKELEQCTHDEYNWDGIKRNHNTRAGRLE